MFFAGGFSDMEYPQSRWRRRDGSASLHRPGMDRQERKPPMDADQNAYEHKCFIRVYRRFPILLLAISAG